MRILAASITLALASSLALAQESTEWLEYDSADIDVINDGVAFGPGPGLVLETDTLEKAQIFYDDPTVIQYQDGSVLILKRFTPDNLADEFGQQVSEAIASDESINVSDIPAMMLYSQQQAAQSEFDNPQLVSEFQKVGQRLLSSLEDRSKRFFAQQNTSRLWFVLGDQQSIAMISDSRMPNQFVLVRSEKMSRSDFMGQIVNGALQPQGDEWSSEERDVPKQHTIPLPR